MDIFVEELKKIQETLRNTEHPRVVAIARKWGLLTLSRMETSFYAFRNASPESEMIHPDFDFSGMLEQCIDFVCDGTPFPVRDRIRELDEFLHQLYICQEQHPDDFICLALYFSQALQDLCDYLELFDNDPEDPLRGNVDEFILSAISEDFFIDFHELESIEDFAEHPLVTEEIRRIWDDYQMIQDCTGGQLRERAEAYRKLNVQAIPELLS